ncbi:MAG: electron transfer flavoprotein subunit alpha/FixB family protein [Thermoplasmata archaeon]|nr:MAG: electron transfer flavoprotein subunit alpha/FixB family protein [Thermoplasmata archaeon]RLF53649.1 MAG: electron transfer flavoprotein subunit alpha/FixB family protein [Thermoplasmata archaeon]
MVLVYSDDKKLMLELLNKAGELAKNLGKKVNAVVIGKNDNLAQEYLTYGADNVIVVETDLKDFKVEEYTEYLEKTIKETGAETILIGSNKNGKELASRLAGKLNAGCVIDVNNVYVKDKKLVTERIVYSGNAIAVEQFNSKPEIVTIPPKVFEPHPGGANPKGEVVKKKFNVEKYASKILKIQEMQTGDVNVEDAEIIVSCGRGFKNKDDIKLAEELADVLKGKTIGCSRPIAADLKWLSEDHWIGLSGHKVKPKLYIAAGISGQIQHIAGMRESGIIVAINKDPEALIFKSADYGIVGDLYEVLPKLTAAVKEKTQ